MGGHTERLTFDAIYFEDGQEMVQVVGESHYQAALNSICGKPASGRIQTDCTAVLVPEPSNPYDPNAIVVQIGAMVVGYLSREDAVVWGDVIRTIGRVIACPARIARRGDGGTSNMGVFLKLPPPAEAAEEGRLLGAGG